MEKKILIIEDNPAELEALHLLLQETYAIVGEALTAENGLDMFENYEPDIVLLDFGLVGEKTGLDVLKEMKELNPLVKIIMVTGNTEDDIFQKALDGGADGYILKPYTDRMILKILENVSKKYKKRAISTRIAEPVLIKMQKFCEEYGQNQSTFIEAAILEKIKREVYWIRIKARDEQKYGLKFKDYQMEAESNPK